MREERQMDDDDIEKDQRLRQAVMRQYRARQEVQEEKQRKMRRVGWTDQVKTRKVVSLKPWYDELWHRSPGSRAESVTAARGWYLCMRDDWWGCRGDRSSRGTSSGAASVRTRRRSP